MRAIKRFFHRLFVMRRRRPVVMRPPDPRVDANPWLAEMLDLLGERYRLGVDAPLGIQVTRRTGKARFNAMRVFVRPNDRAVLGEYDVRVQPGRSLEEGRTFFDSDISPRLTALGLSVTEESVEDWGGQVISRRYEGVCPDAGGAARAVRFFCEESEQVVNLTND